MTLILEVVAYKEAPLSSPLVARFDEKGGSIGRKSDNHLVLPDGERVIGRYHGEIQYDQGRFIYIDKSLNGTELCRQNRRLTHDSIRLVDGDRLKIGEYELLVRMESQGPELTQPFFLDLADSPTSAQPEATGRFNPERLGLFDEKAPPATGSESCNFIGQPASSLDSEYPPPSQEGIPEAFSFESLFGDDPPATPGGGEDRSALLFPNPDEALRPVDRESVASIPALDGPIKGSKTTGGEPDLIAEPFPCGKALRASEPPSMPQPERESPPFSVADQTSPVQSAILPRSKAPQPPVAPIPDGTTGPADLFRAFLDGAALPEVPGMTMEEQIRAMTVLGVVYREMVEGLMMLLQARTGEKSEIRAAVTTIGRDNNNPLKCFPTAEPALRTLVFPQYPGYLDAASAIREGFADIMHHQVAMRVAIQASLSEIIKNFDPENFERRFRDGLVFQKKAKCWDAYSREYPRLADEAVDNLFSTRFGDIYDEKLRRLRESQGDP